MEEPHDFEQQKAALEATLDALPLSKREIVMGRLRDAMIAAGDQLSAQDDNICKQFAEGSADIRQVQEHFGDRMWRAFGTMSDAG